MSDDERARLEAAGLVAPIVRGMDETTLRRRVHTYDRETGEPVREVTVRQLIGGLAKVTALEVEVVEGKRPTHATCEGCGKVFKVNPGPGRFLRTTCDACRSGGQTVCACGCGKSPPKRAFSERQKASRKGGPWMCRVSTRASMLPELTPEQRSDRTRKAWATRRAKAAAVLSSSNGRPQKTDPHD